MVDPLTLVFDISSVAISTAIPGVAWALLFAVAWTRRDFAESLGLGPRTFWLLLPGALLASFALLPVALVSNDVLAVSFAGAAFPLAVGVLALGRIAPPIRRAAALLFVPLLIETAVLLGVVLVADAGQLTRLASQWGMGVGTTETVVVILAAVAFTAPVTIVVGRSAGTASPAVAGIFAATSAVLVLTFAGSQAIPGVGIAEAFPYFLLPPVSVGVVSALVAPRLFPGREAYALPAAFLSGSWGVVLGADVLRQPPLYTGGPSGLYAVGGAGVLDLVYLSGFLGLLGAWAAHRVLGRSLAPVGAPLPATPVSPTSRLREAYAHGVDGALTASVGASAAAAHAAALQAHRLRGTAPSDPGLPWKGLPVPGWVVSDQANLDNVARSGANEPRETYRAYVTARALVRLGQAIGRPRFASIAQRLAAFGIDVAVLGAGASATFAVIVLATPGDVDAVLNSIALNAAVYGFVALALIYFAVAELWRGATVGKRLVGIEVRDRTLGPVGGLSAFVRNVPLLPVMTLYSVGLSFAWAVAMRGISSSATLAGLGASAGALAIAGVGLVVLAGVGFAGAVGVATIAVTAERQRVGDLWAETWVVRALSGGPVPASTPTLADRSG